MAIGAAEKPAELVPPNTAVPTQWLPPAQQHGFLLLRLSEAIEPHWADINFSCHTLDHSNAAEFSSCMPAPAPMPQLSRYVHLGQEKNQRLPTHSKSVNVRPQQASADGTQRRPLLWV